MAEDPDIQTVREAIKVEMALDRLQNRIEAADALADAIGEHAELCCRNDVPWREQQGSHEKMMIVLGRYAHLRTLPPEPVCPYCGRRAGTSFGAGEHLNFGPERGRVWACWSHEDPVFWTEFPEGAA